MAGNFCLQVTWALFLILSVYVKALGGSDAQVGAVMGGAGLSALIAIPAVALLVDRYGRRPFMIAGGLCAVVGSLIFVLLDYLSVWFFVARVVQGVGFALYSNASLTLLADLLPADRRAKGVGFFGLAGNTAIAIGPPIAEAIVEATGATQGSYRLVFALASALAIGGAIMSLKVHEPPKPRGSLALRPWRRADAWAMREPTFLALIQGAGFGVLVTFVPAYAQASGVIFTTFFLAYTTTVVLARTLGGRLVDAPDRHRLVTPFLLLGTVAILVVAVRAGAATFVASGVLFGFAHGVLYPVLTALAIDKARPEHRGKSVGLFSLGFALGANLLVIPYGAAADALGYGWMFTLAAATLAAGAWYAYEYGKRHPYAPRPAAGARAGH
jgi:MFS family permease